MYFLCTSYNLTKTNYFLNQVKMAKNNDNGSLDAGVAIMKFDMTLSDFKMMKVEALRDFLSLRKKSTNGDYETLASRCVLKACFCVS